MTSTIEVVYSDSQVFYDKNYLRYLLREERDGFVEIYVEENFPEESWKNQKHFMEEYPYFGNKILDDYDLDNEEKIKILLNQLTQSDNKEGKIVLVDGAMGGGKTGFGSWVIDEYHTLKPFLNYFFVTKSPLLPTLPNWFHIVDSLLKVKINSVALIDEGAIQLNSRRSMTKDNIDASELLVKLRQKGITMIFLVQNTKMVDANVRRLASIRALKYGISFGTDDKTSVSDDLKFIRERLKPKTFSEVYIENLSTSTHLKITHGLPDWWDDDSVSKYMKNWEVKEKKQDGEERVQSIAKNL